MAEKKGALDGMDISKLRKQAAGSFESDKSGDKDKIRTNPATTENSEIFQVFPVNSLHAWTETH